MEDNNQKQPEPQPKPETTQSKGSFTGEKVIRPSESLVQEMHAEAAKTAQNLQSNPPQQTPPTENTTVYPSPESPSVPYLATSEFQPKPEKLHVGIYRHRNTRVGQYQ